MGLLALSDQPPSGGCVLKLALKVAQMGWDKPAAFGRLCVETYDYGYKSYKSTQPPSGGCVLKPVGSFSWRLEKEPAAFGRLCVETENIIRHCDSGTASRLRAAVC